MNEIREIIPGGYYVFESKVAANSNYIENLLEAQKLLVYAKYYLKGYLTIHDYIITRHGWQILVKLKSEESILKMYYATLKKKKKGLVIGISIWKIVSERIRLFISTYARAINFERGRSGTLVRSSFTRYYFESINEAEVYLKKIRNQQVKLYQRKKKYRGNKIHYRIGKRERQGSVFLCSKELKSLKRGFVGLLESDIFIGLADLVVQELVVFTKKSHLSKIPLPNPIFSP